MNWNQFWNQKGTQSHPLEQVGRIRNGKVLDQDLMQRIAKRIVEQAQIHKSHAVLDVCCGNGELSRLLLPHCASLTGVDFSEILIQQARQLDVHHQTWMVGDAATFDAGRKFDRILLYFSFQYFENQTKAEAVLDNLCAHLEPGGILLLGDIPDSRKWFRFYKNPMDWLRYIRQTFTKTNTMGKFWNPNKLAALLEQRGLRVEIEGQENWQPFCEYRFDILAYS
ncbi:MAG: class I SAM-dependent methyltransferase [Bacteroidetes bacterium]|nr:class I SAM-dependent methyltransferase [Bacteroidota bacterium]